jgi:hypothetical protein
MLVLGVLAVSEVTGIPKAQASTFSPNTIESATVSGNQMTLGIGGEAIGGQPSDFTVTVNGESDPVTSEDTSSSDSITLGILNPVSYGDTVYVSYSGNDLEDLQDGEYYAPFPNFEVTNDTPAPASAPTVTGVSPSSGPTTGGTSVTITGTGFTGATVVDFGSTPASSYKVNSDTSITATAPAGTTGSTDVTVTTPGGTSATSANDQFTYVSPPVVMTNGSTVTYDGTSVFIAPTLTTSDPDSSTLAGATISITSGFQSYDMLNFVNTGKITGSYNLSTGVLTLSGTDSLANYQTALRSISFSTGSTNTSTRTISFKVSDGSNSSNSTSTNVVIQGAPTVTGVSPSSGPTTGGTSVTITGTGFTGATVVDFGSTPASSCKVNSDTSITATAPAGTTGATDVTVTTPSGTSATSVNDQFNYVAVGGGGPVPPFINTVSFMEDAKVGTPYSAQLVTSGGTQPFRWSIASGSLPNGLTLNAQGQITGTPTGLGGQYPFTVKVTDSNNFSATRQLTLTVDGPTSLPSITTTSLTPDTVGQPYNQTLDATGGTSPYTWSVTQGTLPSGLALDAQTGEITGTPTASGVSTITVQSKDANGMTATQTFQIDVTKPNEREIVWNGQIQNVPAIVGNNGGMQTTYMPIWYVMQLLKSMGIENTWNGHHWNMTTSMTPDLSNIQAGAGNTSIYLNGTLVQQVDTETQIDPSTNRPTTYMPIWYVERVLNRVGLQCTWNGTTWAVTQQKS